MISPNIFKAYDIRGIVGQTMVPDTVYQIGRAVGADAISLGHKSFVIGRDGRLSGPDFAYALSVGLREAGIDVIDLGMVATPMVYFAAHELGTECGIMITGSHNPAEYNGLKMVVGGQALYGERIQSLYHRIVAKDFSEGEGNYREGDIVQTYIDRITRDVRLTVPMKIAIDCGNGVAGAFAGELFRSMGASVTELFCDVDGTFPNHHPDPAHPENLADLINALRTTDAEIGLAFDGDGDRLGVVTKDGQIIYPDRQLMMFAKDVLTRHPGGTIIYDVKCTRNIAPLVRACGGTPMMWKTGHSLIKAKLAEVGAPLAGEMSGHLFFKDRWYGFDDGMYAGARLLELLSRGKADGADPSEMLNSLPNSISTPELQLKLEEGENFTLIDKLQVIAPEHLRDRGVEEVALIDGLRVEYADGFGLARSSNTTPVIVLRFEADNEAALARIEGDFRELFALVKPGAVMPF
jgi:phosphomannomutase / phosphoglucomutase